MYKNLVFGQLRLAMNAFPLWSGRFGAMLLAGDRHALNKMAHFRWGCMDCWFRRATAGEKEDMTPRHHPSRDRVGTFLVNEPLQPWFQRESVWARGTAPPGQSGWPTSRSA